jgi:putative DNA methylase
MNLYKKKLIEVALPLDVINAESAKEKTIRQGHPSTLHLWWARRPLAACRAILFAQLVDDPSSDVKKFPTIEAQNKERRRLFRIIEELVKWENINNKKLLADARSEILHSSGGAQVKVLDPFAGGGSIPLEAKRLGLDAYANDLNPLPVLLNIVLLNLVGRFKLSSPTSGGMDCTSQQALSEDLLYWANRLEEKVNKRVGKSYVNSSGNAVPLVYFWSRTIICPNPACGIELPLVSSWNISDRKNSECHFKPVLLKNEKRVDVSVHFDKETRLEPTIHRTGGK